MKIHKPVIYLDMDGVSCDFVSAAIAAQGHDVAEIMEIWRRDWPGEYFLEKILDIDRDQFWEPIHALKDIFWANLAPYPWFEQLHDELQSLGQVVFLSTGTYEPFCLAGKLQWLQRLFGRNFKEYIFTTYKSLLAGPNTLLIDDFEPNVTRFREAGGSAILFPQIWNRNHARESEGVTCVLEQVRIWRDGLD